MIVKCENCSHLFELTDPAIGWEANMDVGTCPGCNVVVSKASNHVRLINYLLIAQLLSVFALTGITLANPEKPDAIFIAILALSTFSLLHLGNRKGTAVPLTKVGDAVEGGPINKTDH